MNFGGKKHGHTPRRWRQRIFRCVIIVILLLILGYATMPMWIPTGHIRQYLAGTMSEQMQADVSIKKVSIGWAGGIVLHELTINSPEGFRSGRMIHVRSVRMPFSPLKMIIKKSVDWMEIDRPRLWVKMKPTGDVNVAALQKLKFDVQPKRVRVSDAQAWVDMTMFTKPPARLKESPDLLRMHVKDVELLTDPPGELRRLTLSGQLQQKKSNATMSLNVLTAKNGGKFDDPDTVATASLSFAGLQLDELPISQAAGLPLKKLAGTCSGSLQLQLTGKGYVERINSNLSIRKLDVQPLEAPRIPVIDKAGLRVSAAYDPLSSEIVLSSLSMHLPGADLEGNAVLGDLRTLHWDIVKSLELEGVLRPQQLVGLFTGKQTFGPDICMSGSAPIELDVRRRNGRLPIHRFEFRADMSGLNVSKGENIIKPTGRRTQISLKGQLDRRNWRLDAEDIGLVLGKNQISAAGSVTQLHKTAATPKQHSKNGQSDEVRGKPDEFIGVLLANMNLSGKCLIKDVEPLAELAGPEKRFLADVKLRQRPVDDRGPVEGMVKLEWLLRNRPMQGQGHNAGGTQVDLRIMAGSDINLRVGEQFNKPFGRKLNVNIMADVDGAKGSMENLDAGLLYDNGQIKFEDAVINPSADGMQYQGKGMISATELHDILRLFPTLADTGINLRGGFAGGVSFSTNLKDRRGEFDVVFQKLNLSQTTHLARGAKEPTEPLWTLTGKMKIDGSYEKRKEGLRFRINGDADEAGFVSNGARRRLKPAGISAGATISGELRVPPRDTSADKRRCATIYVNKAKMHLAQSKITLSGHADINLPGNASAVNLNSRQAKNPRKTVSNIALNRFETDFDSFVRTASDMYKIFPELGELAKRYGLKGDLDIAGRCQGDNEKLKFEVNLDATKLAMRPIKGLSKPAGLKTLCKLRAEIPANTTSILIRDFSGEVADWEFMGDGEVEVGGHKDDRGLIGPKSTKFHVALRTEDVGTIRKIYPDAEKYNLAGGLFAEVEGQSGRKAARLKYLTIIADGLKGRFEGKDIFLDGRIAAGGLKYSQQEGFALSTFQTDATEFRIGRNHGWIIADFAGIPEEPAGTFKLLCEYIDNKDLQNWLSKISTGKNKKIASKNAEDSQLTAKERKQLNERCNKTIAAIRKYTSKANLAGQVSISRLKYYDVSVEKYYKVQNLESDISINQGDARAHYVAGLNGGCLDNRYEIHLSDATPSVAAETDMRDVVATDAIQRQLAEYFPGNTVYGYFNRMENLTIPLQNIICNAMDGRYPLRPEGTAKTVTIDGMVQGRAAPAFVTTLFPGLNLARYRYQKMTAFTELKPDGTAVNDMIFNGHVYDIYMEGTTNADKIGNYMMGLILLSSPQSPEWNHNWKQGRIPILKIKARIEGGKMHYLDVAYPWPTETIGEIAIKNNIFYRIWLNTRKQKNLAK